ncbi:trichohyalin-like [Erpetoichthys calabaricus]|uniref:Trichohyalin-like n=1 Tax=Erpetoichthys calabaricus TaxID=27687 RepID=A0A8C4SEY4_ERPCA|nr:trichohyalin-like [Erpetoichthys calabaricus]
MAAAGKIQDFGAEMRSDENGTERTFSNLRQPINLRIVLLGTAQAEKIQVGNLLLGKMEFILECSTKGRMNKSERRGAIRGGKEITVVNTPDLLDPCIFLEELKMEMEQCTRLCFPGPHAFLIVLREGAFEDRDREAITLIEEIFGRSVFDHSLLVFTKHTHTSKMLKECLREATRHLQQLVDRCKKRYHLLNIEDVNNDSQVMELIRNIEEMRGGNPENCYRSSWLSRGAEGIQFDLKIMFDKILRHMQAEYNSQMFLKIKEMKRKQKMEETKMKQTLNEEYIGKEYCMKQDYEEKYLEKEKKMKDEFQQKETEMNAHLLEMWGNKLIKTEIELTQTYEQIKDNVTSVLRKHRNQSEFLKYDEESKGEHLSKKNENLKQDQKTRISYTDQKTLAEKQKNEEWGNDLKQLSQSPEEAYSGMFETVWMECEVEWHQLKWRIQQKHEEDLIKREKLLKQKIKTKFNEREKEKIQQKDAILNQFSKKGIQEQASEPEYYFESQSQKNRNTMKETLESNSLNKLTEEEKKQTTVKKEPKDRVQITLWKDAKNEKQKLKINEDEDLKERKRKKSKALVEEVCKKETVLALENHETNMFHFDLMRPNTCQTKMVKYSGDTGFDKAQQDIHQCTEDVKRRNKQHEQNTQFAKPQDIQTDKKELSKTEHDKQKKDEPIPKNDNGHMHKEEKTTASNNPQGKRSANGNVQIKEVETLSGHQKCAISGMREKDKHTKLSLELGQQQINTLNVQKATKQSKLILNKGSFNDQQGPKASKDEAQEINKSVVKEDNKKTFGSNQLPFGKHETDLIDSTKAVVIQGQSEIMTTCEKDEDVGDRGVKKAEQDPPKRKEDKLMMKRKQEFEHEQFSEAQKQNREYENELRKTEPESQKGETLIRQNENKQIYKEDMNRGINDIQTQVNQDEYSKVDSEQEFSRNQNNVNVDSMEKEAHTISNKEYTEEDKTLQKGDMNKLKSNKDVDLKDGGQDVNLTIAVVNKNKEDDLSQISLEEHEISQCDHRIPKKTNINVETYRLKDRTEKEVINTEQDLHLRANNDGMEKKKTEMGYENLIKAQEHEYEKQKGLSKIKPEEKHEEIFVTKQENDQVDTDSTATGRNNSERQKCQDETEELSKKTKEVKTESDTKEKRANMDREYSQQHKEICREQVNETECRSGEPNLAFSEQEQLKSNKDGNLQNAEHEMSKSPEEATVDGCSLNQTNTCCPDNYQINVASDTDGIKDTEHKDVRKTGQDLHAGLNGETSERNQTY